MIPRRRCVRIHPYVDEGVAQQLDIHCASSGATVSAVVEAALREHLERTGVMTTIMTRLDRIGRRIERTHRDLEVFMEAFAVWVKIWFAYMPRIDGDNREIAARQAESRFAEFVELVVQRIAAGEGLFDDLSRAGLRGPDAALNAREARIHKKGDA